MKKLAAVASYDYYKKKPQNLFIHSNRNGQKKSQSTKTNTGNWTQKYLMMIGDQSKI